MKTLLPISAIAALMLGGAEPSIAAKLPTFERDGFPITLHQLRVMGPYGVQEQAPTLSFTLDGMPVTPHQLRVLRRDTPRHTDAAKATARRLWAAPLFRKITK